MGSGVDCKIENHIKESGGNSGQEPFIKNIVDHVIHDSLKIMNTNLGSIAQIG